MSTPYPQQITVKGSDWFLKRDAADPSIQFAHDRVQFAANGCDRVSENEYMLWGYGIILPNYGTNEKPLGVMYIGFVPQPVAISFGTMTHHQKDMFNIYCCDMSTFTQDFFSSLSNPHQHKEVEHELIVNPRPLSHAEIIPDE